MTPEQRFKLDIDASRMKYRGLVYNGEVGQRFKTQDGAAYEVTRTCFRRLDPPQLSKKMRNKLKKEKAHGREV